MRIGFHSPHLTERGTSVAIYDYAHYSETILGNTSIVFYQENHPVTHAATEKKFCERFTCLKYRDIDDLERLLKEHKIDALYSIVSGSNPLLVSSCPNLIHAVFDIAPCGERYAAISHSLSKGRVEVVPHIVTPSTVTDNLRSTLGIPSDATVIGRHGGRDTFSVPYVKTAVVKALTAFPTVYFLFLNTDKFIDHPRVIFLPTTWDIDEKSRFINSCDAMLHARVEGESFGLAVAEFSIRNKPVMTMRSAIDNCHLDILGDKALVYSSEGEIVFFIHQIKTIAASRTDWNAYQAYTPELVMKQFRTVFLEGLIPNRVSQRPYGDFRINFYPDDCVSNTIIADRLWEPHLVALFRELLGSSKNINPPKGTDGPIAIDVGGHIGLHTLTLAQHCTQVHTFEPCSSNYALLRRNIVENKLSHKVELHPCALMDYQQCGNVVFSGGTNMGDINVFPGNGSTAIKTLDAFAFPRVDLMKVDIQGAEIRFLHGAVETINKHRPLIVIEAETHTLKRFGCDSNALFKQLRILRYIILLVDYEYPSDHLCIPEERFGAFWHKYNHLITSVTQDNPINNNLRCGIRHKIDFRSRPITEVDVFVVPGTRSFLKEPTEIIHASLRKNGFQSKIVDVIDPSPTRRYICFGLNASPTTEIPPNSIIVNMEQLYDSGYWNQSVYLNLMRRHTTWDYSKANQRYLKARGIDVETFDYGYLPLHESPRCGLPVDIDVLMIATPHERRNAIIDGLRARGINAILSNTLWDEERARYLQRTKIVLNIHYHYIAGLLELPRIACCLANHCFIISEDCNDIDDYPHLKDCLVFAPYDSLIATVGEYLESPDKMRDIAERGYQKFKEIESAIPILA